MKWIKKKLYQWMKEANDEANSYAMKGLVAATDVAHAMDDNPVLNFRIFSAQNGTILEFRHYDRKTDRNNTSTFIVGENEDVSEYVRKCLPMELMKVSR
jgi:hypothetical protein